MLAVSEELKDKLRKLNDSLRSRFPTAVLERREIRRRLMEIGTFHRIKKFTDGELKAWLGDGSLIGVDGSVNSTKGSERRALSFFQALAKGTKGEEKWVADVYTPLLAEEREEEGQAAREAQKRGKMLSRLELTVAREAILEWSPCVMMMDGSLLHYEMDDRDLWNELRELAESHGVLLVGVSEEVESKRLANELLPQYPGLSDRDLFHGVLEIGEAFEWKEWAPNSALWKMVFRTSKSPQPVGVDGLETQREARFELLRLVYTLSPEQGRGIPFWLDIVDNQVRVTDALVESLVEQYIDPDLRHRLLLSKRSERVI
jgi:NurA domain